MGSSGLKSTACAEAPGSDSAKTPVVTNAAEANVFAFIAFPLHLLGQGYALADETASLARAETTVAAQLSLQGFSASANPDVRRRCHVHESYEGYKDHVIQQDEQKVGLNDEIRPVLRNH